ncbi:MAG TPA: glycogen debranching enzyme, partial [Mycobacterium sp.]|nr:glycogen debranching enzyme [Mycobacterium sp.]
EMTHEDWGGGFGECVAVFLNGDAIPEPDGRGQRIVDDSFLLCFNAHENLVEFVAPDDDYALQWTAELDTNEPTGAADLVVKAGEKISVPGRSLLVLRKTL